MPTPNKLPFSQTMTEISLTATTSTPAVFANPHTGILEMNGDSYPENSFEFFSSIFAWTQNFLRESELPLRVDLRLLYLNTSSVKAMMDIFDLLEDAHSEGREVSVNWYYDPANDRIAELAQEFKEDCSFAFEIVEQR